MLNGGLNPLPVIGQQSLDAPIDIPKKVNKIRFCQRYAGLADSRVLLGSLEFERSSFGRHVTVTMVRESEAWSHWLIRRTGRSDWVPFCVREAYRPMIIGSLRVTTRVRRVPRSARGSATCIRATHGERSCYYRRPQSPEPSHGRCKAWGKVFALQGCAVFLTWRLTLNRWESKPHNQDAYGKNRDPNPNSPPKLSTGHELASVGRKYLTIPALRGLKGCLHLSKDFFFMRIPNQVNMS